MNDAVVFATSCVDLDRDRYQNWINYYTDFFKECGVDLLLINDGTTNIQLDFGNVEFRTFDKRLGRQSIWIFPGWKRSFYYGILWLYRKYKYIAHVESDCWITSEGKKDFLYYLRQEGYFTGYTPTYNFPEASLQIINTAAVRQYIVDKYCCVENWHEDIDFEQDLNRLKPTYILNGDRIEGIQSRIKENFTFVSGTSYEDFLRQYG